MINVLQIVKEYEGNHHLFNEQFIFNTDRFRVTVCYLTGKNDGRNQLENKIHKVIHLNCNDKEVKWFRPSVVKKVQNIIDQEEIDIVNCHRHRATLIGIAAAHFSQKKPYVFSTVHGFERKAKFCRKIIDFLFFKKLTGLIAVSDALKRHVFEETWGLAADRVWVIQNGSGFQKFLAPGAKAVFRKELFPELPTGFWFGTVGRLVPVKNHERLLQAFARVLEYQPEARLLIAGQGRLEESLKKLAESLGLSNYVNFLGFREDIPQLLKTLDVFVFPSLREGFGMALLEAMASGLPVIGARVGGIPEILSDCPGGRLVNPINTDELAATMIELIQTPPSCLEEMGKLARQRALGSFSSNRMVSQYEELFSKTVGAMRSH